jgi:hypothetical protein
MSLRAFVDSGGNEWQVFDVVPRTAAERRSQERRALEASQAADRRDGDRRFRIVDLGRLSTINESWLCFERGSDRRRLSPIPNDWTRCPDEALEDYCRRARPARRLHAAAARH